MKARTSRIAVAALLTAGIPLIAAGCGAADEEPSATQAPAATATTAAPAATTASATSSASLPAPPSGATQISTKAANGAMYVHYSVSGQTPADVVGTYQSALESSGFAVKSTGGGGGGWGGYGGSGAGISADNGTEWIDVEAGGQDRGPTYWEVCIGPSAQSVDDCREMSDGNDSTSKQS